MAMRVHPALLSLRMIAVACNPVLSAPKETGKVGRVSENAEPERDTGAEAYTAYRPLLFTVLGRLARGGYALSPDEGLDLIHDFFIEAWPGLVVRFDPEKGKLSTYVYGAFVRFARPRIIRLNRWRSEVDFETKSPNASVTGSALSDESAADDEILDGLDMRRLSDALAAISSEDREFLLARLQEGQSERTLAKRYGISRYRVRERSAETLARLISAFGEHTLLDERDWPVATAAFCEGRTDADIAASLKLTQEQVRLRKQRILGALSRAFPVLNSTGTGG